MPAKTSKATSQTKMPEHLCCVTINYQSFLLPSDKGRQLVALMEKALSVKRTWREGQSGRLFELDDAHEIEYESVKHAQVVAPEPTAADVAAAGPLSLRHEPLKLEGKRS